MVGRRKSSVCVTLLSLFTLVSSGSVANTVKNLEIVQSGILAEGRRFPAEEDVCSTFKPEKYEVVAFFNRARPVGDPGALIHARYSPCSAEGVITFSDGSSGKWVLQSGGIATFFPENGGYTRLFYKKNKWHDPYTCMYGLSDEGEC